MKILMGINRSCVDELLQAGTDEWKTHSDATLERSKTTGNQQAPFKFSGIHITESDSMNPIDLDFCLSKI